MKQGDQLGSSYNNLSESDVDSKHSSCRGSGASDALPTSNCPKLASLRSSLYYALCVYIRCVYMHQCICIIIVGRKNESEHKGFYLIDSQDSHQLLTKTCVSPP